MTKVVQGLLRLTLLTTLAVPAGAQPLPGLDPHKALTQYGLDAWSNDDGLPQGTVNGLAQTPDGYLWIATYGGLARFDGVRFRTFDASNSPGLGGNGIARLAVDPTGALWVALNGGGLARFVDGRFQHWGLEDGLPGPSVTALETDAGGAWAGTNGGLVRVTGGRVEVVPATAGVVINAVVGDGAGGLWVGTHGLGLWRIAADGTVARWSGADGVGSDHVTALLRDTGGRLWIGTGGGGLARFEGGRFRRWSLADGLFGSVWALLESRTGVVWVGGVGGLARFRADDTFTVLGREALGPLEVLSLLEDREGSLWAGTNGDGVRRLRDGRFTTWTTQEGMSADFVYGVTEDAAGTVYAGTRGGLDELRDGRWTRHTPEDGFCHGFVRSVAVGPSGSLWAGTYGGGVCERTPGGWRRHDTGDGLAHDNVRAVLVARDGGVWAGTVGGLSHFDGTGWTSYRRAEGLAHESILCLLEARDGTLWIGTESGGAYRFRDGRFERLTLKDGLASDVVLAFLEDGQGRIWAGTNAGLTRLGGGTPVSFTMRDGLPADSVLQLVDDEDGHLWLGSARGVTRVSWLSLEARGAGGKALLDAVTLDRADGMKSSQVTAPVQPSGLRTRDGRLWFSTSRGLSVLDPRRGGRDDERPHVVIEELLADGVAHDARHAVTLAPGTQRIELTYTGLCLLAPSRMRFRYRLDGYDVDWVDAGARRSASYTSLPPGHYSFRVLACNGDGICNESGSPLSIRLRPRFHQTAWFYAACVLGLALVVTGGHLTRTAQLRRRERELELLVAERTRGLVEEKERAESSRREAERQRRIAEQADALKTQLLAIAAHDLRNPLQSVVGSAQLIRAGVAGDVLDELSDTIHRGGQRMLRLVDDLLTGAALDMGGLELRRARVDLAAVGRAVVAESRPRAQAKQQVVTLTATGDTAVVGDGDRLHEVLDNLVSNAIKYSPPGTAIDIAVAATDRATIRVEVRDHGPGLDPAELVRVFGRFERLSAQPTGGETSSGLGLSIVRQLVELHGGKAWAESAGPGRGSTFVVELPSGGPAVA